MAKARSTKQVIEASTAVALGAKLCEPQVIPMYPITPQTHIVEHLADYVNDGDLNAEMIHAESEHAALSAAIGSCAAGSRTFTATASQGLALMHEVMFIVSGMRLPVVMAVANRALSAPINIWNDHQDSISERDAGWIQLYVESAQEALDTVIMSFKLAETVELPVMVCLDGFTLSHVWEPVDIPAQAQVRKYLPKWKPSTVLDPKKPVTMGPVSFPNTYMDFKKQQQDAILASKGVIVDINSSFKKSFKRSYGDGLMDLYRMSDAKVAIIGLGTICSTSRVVVDELRKKGMKVGLIKLKAYRPFPAAELRKACAKLESLSVVDRNISLGYEGALASDVKSALYGSKVKVNSFIAGLGGRDVRPEDLSYILTSKDKQTEWVRTQ